LSSRLAAAALLGAGVASAEVYQRPQEALAAAFPAAEIKARDLVLGEGDLAAVQREAAARFRDRLVTFYEARRKGVLEGYAVIHSHPVRTKRITWMMVLDPEGKVRRIEVLAFFEPPEYLPGPHWWARFRGATPEKARDLVAGRGLDAVAGATLSVQTVSEQVRALLLLFERKVRARG
jgi:hypothetical protein